MEHQPYPRLTLLPPMSQFQMSDELSFFNFVLRIKEFKTDFYVDEGSSKQREFPMILQNEQTENNPLVMTLVE